MFFIQRKWIPHESPINMLCGYSDTETVQLYGNLFVWNIDWIGRHGTRGKRNPCDWYNIKTGERGKWDTIVGYTDSYNPPIFGVNEGLFACEEFAGYDTRNVQWYLGDDSWMENGRRWYGYDSPRNHVFERPDGGYKGNDFLPIKMGSNAWSIISSETQQVLDLIGYRKASRPGVRISETLSFKDYTVDLTSDQKEGVVILDIKTKNWGHYVPGTPGTQLTFEQFLIQHCWNS